ncbi:hypothetical protein ABCR94_37685 [Streptomyces sp. 21So2-11]|uniref:hypothetical protein n=1 Tax=Streptomyces sp. 21So2-11 TaxID=3144408 RepID=UPI00321B81CB
MTLQPVPGIESSDESVRSPDPEPIYTALTTQWSAAGRLVPGQHDPEWRHLAGHTPWPDR